MFYITCIQRLINVNANVFNTVITVCDMLVDVMENTHARAHTHTLIFILYTLNIAYILCSLVLLCQVLFLVAEFSLARLEDMTSLPSITEDKQNEDECFEWKRGEGNLT